MNSFIGYHTPDTVLNSVEAKIRLADEYLEAFQTLLEHDASVKFCSLTGMPTFSQFRTVAEAEIVRGNGQSNESKVV